LKVIHVFRAGGDGYGLERNIVCTLPGLVMQGIEVVALMVVETRAGWSGWRVADHLARAGIRIYEVQVASRLPLTLSRDLAAVFKAEAPDIIHSHDYKCDLAILVANTYRAAVMTTVHGWCSRTRRERLYEWLELQCCKRMDAVIVFCAEYKRRVVAGGVADGAIHIAPVGVDLTTIPRGGGGVLRERWGVPRGAVLIAQVGRLSQEKRPEVFVEMATDLSARFLGARFVLVGAGGMIGELRRRVALTGRRDAIVFAGYVDSVGDVFDTVDIVVSCSSTEAVPRTLLESSAAGLPVVATAVGGVADIVEDGVTGILCQPGDAEAITKGVARLIGDAVLRRRFGAAARERVARKFSIAACSKRLVEVYESLS